MTTLVEDLAGFGQLYRDRGDDENIFDELKNQWGWGGFTTHDLARCRLAARLVALFLLTGGAFSCVWPNRDWHREAITSRPLLLHAIASRTRKTRTADNDHHLQLARAGNSHRQSASVPSPCSCEGSLQMRSS